MTHNIWNLEDDDMPALSPAQPRFASSDDEVIEQPPPPKKKTVSKTVKQQQPRISSAQLEKIAESVVKQDHFLANVIAKTTKVTIIVTKM